MDCDHTANPEHLWPFPAAGHVTLSCLKIVMAGG
jgi:hypothetical protein